jgi:putative ABC transport system substrate-binding protein
MREGVIHRRSFLTLLGTSAAAWPLAARAQQRVLPKIGYLVIGGPGLRRTDTATSIAFRKGLSEAGVIEGRDFVFEYREAERPAQLPVLADELVRRGVAIIVTTGNANAALAAKSATQTIPVLFVTSSDPVKIGLVAGLNRPGGNVTGFTNFGGELVAKRLELMRELVPHASVIGFLTDPNNSISDGDVVDMEAAARIVGRQMLVLQARTPDEIDSAFASAARQRAGALVVDAATFFNSRRQQITTLAASYGIPANYNTRSYVEAGGLMSYGDERFESYRQTGLYAGRVLKGEKPSELPVLRPTKFEFVINSKTAKALGIEFPASFQLRATEVIE